MEIQELLVAFRVEFGIPLRVPCYVWCSGACFQVPVRIKRFTSLVEYRFTSLPVCACVCVCAGIIQVQEGTLESYEGSDDLGRWVSAAESTWRRGELCAQLGFI